MKKILTIIGARPQFIKAATISRVIKDKYSNKLNEVIVHTGQHYDANMSDVFFDEMSIPKPNYRLNIGGKSHAAMTGEMLIELEQIMLKEQPDIVLIYGDTNSTLAAALSASKLLIPIAHIEAGMRAYNKKVPEEVNRVMSDHVSDLFFCTTNIPADNLRKEGLDKNIHIVGDVMYDAALFYKDIAEPTEQVKDLPKNGYLVTCHRQENTDSKENLTSIFDTLKILAKDSPVIVPLHPRTKKYIAEYNINTENLHIIDPIGYFDMIYLLEHAKMVLTDSGGVQKEAYYFKKPVIVMRDQTEWTEIVEQGLGILTGADKDKILSAVKKLDSIEFNNDNIYGDGNAADKIVALINSFEQCHS